MALERLIVLPIIAVITAASYISFDAQQKVSEGHFYNETDYFKYHLAVARHVDIRDWKLSREEKIERYPILDLYTKIYSPGTIKVT